MSGRGGREGKGKRCEEKGLGSGLKWAATEEGEKESRTALPKAL